MCCWFGVVICSGFVCCSCDCVGGFCVGDWVGVGCCGVVSWGGVWCSRVVGCVGVVVDVAVAELVCGGVG